ncbi:MAG: IPT/TIG domain-containing protein [Bryobacteraceae bacterium]
MYFLALFICGIVHAQIANLTTNDDGSVVWFDTSLPRKNIDEPEQGRIYRLDSSGLQLLASVPREDPALPPVTIPLPPNSYFTNYFDLSAPQSGNTTLLYHARAICFRCTPAGIALTQRYTLTNANGTLRTGTGEARLSRNGRYLLVLSGFPREFYVVDTENPLIPPVTAATPLPPTGPARVIADNGTAVLPGFDGVTLQILSLTKRTELRIPSTSDSAWFFDPSIDAAGSTVLYTLRGAPGPITLRVLRLNDNRETLVHTCAPTCQDASLTAAGDAVFFLENRQLFRTESTAPSSRRLTNEPSGVLRYVASGNGNIVWYVNGAGQLRRHDVIAGLSETLVNSTPGVSNPGTVTLVPGSLVTLTAEGLATANHQAQQTPLPTELAGVRVRINQQPAAIHSLSPTSITFQTPWNITPAPHEVSIETASDSPFRTTARATFPVEAVAPAFLPLQPGVFAIHENWDAFVTPANPAREGEYVHLYATGLGAVNMPVDNGAPSPPNATLQRSINCTMPVLYAGLAPALVGVYQITVRAANTIRNEGYLTCEVEARTALAVLPVLR